jgi:plastocyanin
MNTRLLGIITAAVLLVGLIGAPLMDSVYADQTKKDKVKKAVKKEVKKKVAKKVVKKAVKKEVKENVKDTMKDKVKGAMKDKMQEKAGGVSPDSAPSGTSEVTVDMAKGTASNTECGDQCFIPMNVQVPVGGTVKWMNVDSAAHTATAMDGSFDTSLVNAGKSYSQKFDTAGTFEYMCSLHPWMKGTITVG